ncbi:MAG TPA: branched-chain amino acid ABC transporter permease [Pirellulales bacterium]|nr:branched-chain amino acid ABC transporter permease [Pirellulales bacterium]
MKPARAIGWYLLAAVLAGGYVLIAGRAPALADQVTNLFIFSILALGLSVIVGDAGLLHLGIAAFFGLGAYITGVLTVPANPFHAGFWLSLVASTVGAAAAGLVLAAPVLRLRGDYFAVVTLGFGEVVRFAMRNLEEITGGTRALSPIPPPELPGWLAAALATVGVEADFTRDDRLYYWLNLGVLLVVAALVHRLRSSSLGRALRAVREDELAAASLGINRVRVKLAALTIGSGLAGLAGSLYAYKITSTASPDAFDFSRSVIVLCAVLVGGLGSVRGTVAGVFLVFGFDNLLAPWLDRWLQSQTGAADHSWLVFGNWRLMFFGLALILLMRFRPAGLLGRRYISRGS